MDILKSYEEWLEKEYKDTIKTITLMKDYFTPKEIVNNSCQRALGAFFFIQHFNVTVPYLNFESLYESFHERCEKLLDKQK